jgi:hypothetical protein
MAFNGLYVIIPQNIVRLLTTAVRTFNPTEKKKLNEINHRSCIMYLYILSELVLLASGLLSPLISSTQPHNYDK